MTVRQPKPEDLEAVTEASRKASPRTMRRYGTMHPSTVPKNAPPNICMWPPFKPGDMGWFFVIMEVDGEIVGFGKHCYAKAENMHLDYAFPDPGDTVAECSLCVIDEYQGRGYGTLYSKINLLITKTNGATWLAGYTYTKGALLGIRQRDGFTVTWISPDGKQARHRGRL